MELVDGETREWTIDPSALGLERASLEDLAGGDASENAATIRAVLEGESGARGDIVALNAAAGLVAAGRADGMEHGLSLAREAIGSGSALRSLEALVEVSNG